MPSPELKRQECYTYLPVASLSHLNYGCPCRPVGAGAGWSFEVLVCSPGGLYRPVEDCFLVAGR